MKSVDLATFTEKILIGKLYFFAVVQRVTMSCTTSGNTWQRMTAVGHFSSFLFFFNIRETFH